MVAAQQRHGMAAVPLAGVGAEHGAAARVRITAGEVAKGSG